MCVMYSSHSGNLYRLASDSAVSYTACSVVLETQNIGPIIRHGVYMEGEKVYMIKQCCNLILYHGKCEEIFK